MRKKYFFVILLIFCISFGCSKDKSDFEDQVLLSSYLFSHQIRDSLERNNFSTQKAASSYCDIGDHQKALFYWDKNLNENDFGIPKVRMNGKAIKSTILTEAKKHKWIIFNEQHHNSLHRITLELLLEDLYDQGFTNLGIEHLSNDTTLNQRGYPLTTSTKFYKSPQLFNLVRTALNIGYNIFPYDHDCNSSGYSRELCEVENITDELKGVSGKTVIFCGYDHGVEGEHKSWGKAMAGILKQVSNDDVLTINQTYLSEHSKLGFASPFYQGIDCAQSRVVSVRDSILLNQLELYYDPYDLYIYHPMSNYDNDRPTWMNREGYSRIELRLPSSIKFPCLVYAFNSNEKHMDAAPLDVVEVLEPKESVILFIADYHESIEYVALDTSRNTYTLRVL